MLTLALVIAMILMWIAVMVWAYKDNGGMEEFKKSFKKVLDKLGEMW